MAGWLASGASWAAEPSQPHPNILFITVDDLRDHIGAFGHPHVLTPNIDRLAAQGVLFHRAYCQVPVCGASRASVMTGIRPDLAQGRFTDYNSRADRDTPHAVTLGAHFKAHGYQTLSRGKVFHDETDSADAWSEPPWRLLYAVDKPGLHSWATHHFDKTWLDPASRTNVSAEGRGPYWEAADVPDNAYEDGQTADRAVADLTRLKRMQVPFFLAVGFFRPHLPFNAPKRYYDLYDPEAIPLANNRFPIENLPPECQNSGEIRSYAGIEGWPDDRVFHRQARHAYYASVTYVDAQIGRLLDEIDRLGLAGNTIIVLWSDHGFHLGEHHFWGKHNTLDNALRVPLIVSAPGYASGARTKALVELVDIYPTLVELAGLAPPGGHALEGRSFVPLLKRPDLPWQKAAFSEWRGGRSVKTGRHLYTEWPNGNRMLFDHDTDPDERKNVADDPAFADIVQYLSALLAKPAHTLQVDQ